MNWRELRDWLWREWPFRPNLVHVPPPRHRGWRRVGKVNDTLNHALIVFGAIVL
jgi:hypothetical protein